MSVMLLIVIREYNTLSSFCILFRLIPSPPGKVMLGTISFPPSNEVDSCPGVVSTGKGM